MESEVPLVGVPAQAPRGALFLLFVVALCAGWCPGCFTSTDQVVSVTYERHAHVAPPTPPERVGPPLDCGQWRAHLSLSPWLFAPPEPDKGPPQEGLTASLLVSTLQFGGSLYYGLTDHWEIGANLHYALREPFFKSQAFSQEFAGSSGFKGGSIGARYNFRFADPALSIGILAEFGMSDAEERVYTLAHANEAPCTVGNVLVPFFQLETTCLEWSRTDEDQWRPLTGLIHAGGVVDYALLDGFHLYGYLLFATHPTNVAYQSNEVSQDGLWEETGYEVGTQSLGPLWYLDAGAGTEFRFGPAFLAVGVFYPLPLQSPHPFFGPGLVARLGGLFGGSDAPPDPPEEEPSGPDPKSHQKFDPSHFRR